MRRGCIIAWLWLAAAMAGAAEVMPPAPARHFNDYAGVVSAAAAARIDWQLAEFERTNSSQVVVAVFPKMQSPSSLEDYVHRMFDAWKIGQKANNNGVLLAVFTQDRRIRIEVGYGLEGALPDALAKRIIEDEIAPHFRGGNYEAGLAAGVEAILSATRGEYRAKGGAVRGLPTGVAWAFDNLIFTKWFPWHLGGGFLLLQVLCRVAFGRRRRRGTLYDRRGRRRYDSDSGWGWFGGGWGGGSSGGGGWSSGGGGFSGGGGSSGGGGASGSW